MINGNKVWHSNPGAKYIWRNEGVRDGLTKVNNWTKQTSYNFEGGKYYCIFTVELSHKFTIILITNQDAKALTKSKGHFLCQTNFTMNINKCGVCTCTKLIRG